MANSLNRKLIFNKHSIWSGTGALIRQKSSNKEDGTYFQVKFGNIKQPFAAGLKALMLHTDPMMLERFGHHVQQHLRRQKIHVSYPHWGTLKC